MPEGAETSPETYYAREQLYDRRRHEYVPAILPTDTLKVARTVGSSHAGTAMYRRTFGGLGTVALITRFTATRRGGTPLGAAAKLAVVDRSGTVDHLWLPSDGYLSNLGAATSPVYAVSGSFRVLLGSQAGGSVGIALEAVVHRFGTETVSA